MVKVAENTFIHETDKETGAEVYHIQFDYGIQTIKVKEGVKITLDYVHGGFEPHFERVGNDLIVGDDWFSVMMEPLGVGHGKEVWDVVDNGNSTFTVTIDKYKWQGSQFGYSVNSGDTHNRIMTAEELADFQSQNSVTVSVGKNTLYTTWAVLPNPVIHYHMEDRGFYAPANGKIILKDYFLYGKETIFIGDKLLSEIIKEGPYPSELLKYDKKRYVIYDTFLDDELYGGGKSDKIYSAQGDDTIAGEKGNDKIYLGAGNKTIVLSEGDGKDIVYGVEKSNSVRFSVDTDDVYFTKSGNNLVLNRDYGGKTEKTVINNYFKNFGKDNKIIVSEGDIDLITDFTKELQDGGVYLKATGSKVIKGTDYNDEAYSSSKNETFLLGRGSDVIHFRNDGGFSFVPYSFGKDVVKIVQGSHVRLDIDGIGGDLSFERKGNDAIITARHRIELCGRDNGKEEWVIKKSGKDAYTVTKTTYHFTGYGYKSYSAPSVETMTKSELDEFQTINGVSLKVGKNTLYTSWSVVPNPVVHYSMYDSANWGINLGTITLKDYFKFREDSVYIGDKSLQEYYKDEVLVTDKSKSKKSVTIEDTVYDEIIKGGRKADKITSYYGNDTITAGKGDDKIILANGNKTVNINKGDGKDTIIILKSADSADIVFDKADSLSFDRDGNDMLIIRNYGKKSETTIIDNYFKRNLENKITVTTPDFSQDLSPELVGLTMDVICKYLPVDKPFPVDWTVACPVPGPPVVCAFEYPQGNKVDLQSLGQSISAWQTGSSDSVCYFEQPADTNIVLTLSE